MFTFLITCYLTFVKQCRILYARKEIDMSKIHIIAFRANDVEKDIIEVRASTGGLSVSDFIRKALGLEVSGRINSKTGEISTKRGKRVA